MGLRFIEGKDAVVMYDSTSGWAFGPVFDGDEALDKAEAFVEWFETGKATATARSLEIAEPFDGNDARSWTAGALERLYAVWCDEALDADGDLIRDEAEVLADLAQEKADRELHRLKEGA